MGILFKNIIGIDGIIFILAIVNYFIFIRIKEQINNLKYDLYEEKSLLVSELQETEDYKAKVGEIIKEKYQGWENAHYDANKEYNMFIALNSIFPLLGIFGTILGLVLINKDFTNIASNFILAITSTFWGLLFAMIFKTIEGYLSSELETTNERFKNITARVLNKGINK